MTVGLAPPAAAVTVRLGLASTSDAGVPGNNGSVSADLSADGRWVAFSSGATDLDPADTGWQQDVYVKNLISGDIMLASASDTGIGSNGSSAEPAISADGRKVAFYSSATNLDPGDSDTDYDVYVKDLVSGDIVLASTSDTGVSSNALSFGGTLSADGNTVAFASAATNLDPGDTDDGTDVYVKDLVSGDIVLASTNDNGVKSTGDSYDAALSADGETVAFLSGAINFDPADTNNFLDVYAKNLATGDVVLASASDTGLGTDGPSYGTAISADGTTVAFYSEATTLDPADTDIFMDVYLKNLLSGDIVLASTADDGAKGNATSTSPSLSAHGTRVAFSSNATNLDARPTEAGHTQSYIKDLTSGEIVLVSASATGAKGKGTSQYPSLSGLGNRVAFESTATNLHPAHRDGHPGIYVHAVLFPHHDGTRSGVG